MKLDKRARFYIGGLTLLSIFMLGYLFYNYEISSMFMLLFWSLLTIIVESLLILLPNSSVGVSVGSAINLASVIVGGPLIGTISAGLGFLFRFPNVPEKGRVHLLNTPFYKTVFNVSQSTLGTGIMSLAYLYSGASIGEFYFPQAIFILLLGMLINSSIISGLMSILNKEQFSKIWIANIRGVIWSALAVGTLGIIIAIAYIGYGYGAVLLFFGPLLLARYSFRLYVDMRNLYISTIQTLSKTIEARDPYTSGHANRVLDYSVKLAKEIGLSDEKVQNIRTAALLHDIGKIAINDSILNKSSKLTSEEYAEIMKHPSVGAEIVSKMDFFKNIKGIVRYHHERYDGKGYPDGLVGDDIPLEACILAIADAYDAMTSDRPYRQALAKDEALKEIENNAGTQFHPELARTFVSIMSD
ncbi:MAG TPA: HD-GYP domain-containing protein [Tissierellaceae bacterium]|nr:HD-GYP domain-containing protein [Tissierellaceae bacterium]